MTILSGSEFGREGQGTLFGKRSGATGGSLDRLVNGWWRSARQSKAHRRDMEQLEEMPDYLLRDIGIKRSDIQQMVYLGDPTRFDRR